MLRFSAAVASFRDISTCGFYSHIYLIMLSQPKHTLKSYSCLFQKAKYQNKSMKECKLNTKA